MNSIKYEESLLNDLKNYSIIASKLKFKSSEFNFIINKIITTIKSIENETEEIQNNNREYVKNSSDDDDVSIYAYDTTDADLEFL